MSSDAVDVVQRAYDAYARGDIDGMLAMIHPDVEWIAAPGYEDCQGRDQVAAVVNGLEGRGIHLSVVELIDAGDRVVIRIGEPSQEASPDGVPAVEYNVLTVRDGAIVRMQDFLTREDALRTAGLSEPPGS